MLQHVFCLCFFTGVVAYGVGVYTLSRKLASSCPFASPQRVTSLSPAGKLAGLFYACLGLCKAFDTVVLEFFKKFLVRVDVVLSITEVLGAGGKQCCRHDAIVAAKRVGGGMVGSFG
jgi:hypothetical protein